MLVNTRFEIITCDDVFFFSNDCVGVTKISARCDGIKPVWTNGWLKVVVEVDEDWLQDGIRLNGMLEELDSSLDELSDIGIYIGIYIFFLVWSW